MAKSKLMRAAIGFRAKTGRAIAVVLSGTAPEFIWRGEVSLADPADPATGQPYHEVMDLPWNEAVVAVQPIIAAIEAAAAAMLGRLLDEMKSIRCAGVVGSSPKALERIGNPHIRAHAAEGVLFRRVLETAAQSHHLPCVAFAEKDLDLAAHASMLQRLGRAAGSPWRTDEKLAATAAWMALTRFARSSYPRS